MELINFKEFIIKYNNIPVSTTIGDFDGIHLGHQQLINKVLSYSHQEQIKSAVIAFYPHPKQLFIPNLSNFILMNNFEKDYYLSTLDIDYLILIDFDIDFAKQTKEEFYSNYLNKLNLKYLAIGSDFKFGNNNCGCADDLLKYYDHKINIEIVKLLDNDNMKISSSKIRELLHNGLVNEASNLLGHDYFISGEVINSIIYLDKSHLNLKVGNYSVSTSINGFSERGIAEVKDNNSIKLLFKNYKNLNFDNLLIFFKSNLLN